VPPREAVEREAFDPYSAARQRFPIWILAINLPVSGLFVCCTGIVVVALLGRSSPGKGRFDVPPSKPEELARYKEMVMAPAGVEVPLRTFTLDCSLSQNITRVPHRDLYFVTIVAPGSQQVGLAIVKRESSAGREITALLGDGKEHKLTVELGPPHQDIGLDGVVEILHAWRYTGN